MRKSIWAALLLAALALAGLACSLGGRLEQIGESNRPVETGQAAPDSQAGQELFADLECKACHVNSAGGIAPSLDGLYSTQVQLESGETVTADEDYLRESILDPQEKIVAGYGPLMPSFEGRVTETQLVSLVEYIKSLGEE